MSIAAAMSQPAYAVSAAGVARNRRPAGSGWFQLPDAADLPAAATGGPAASAPIGLDTLLAMQEADADAVQDRAAKHHAGSMLTEMSALQRALLHGDGAVLSTTLARLAGLARHVPAAVDPRLAAVVRAIAMRAAVEAARRTAPVRVALNSSD